VGQFAGRITGLQFGHAQCSIVVQMHDSPSDSGEANAYAIACSNVMLRPNKKFGRRSNEVSRISRKCLASTYPPIRTRFPEAGWKVRSMTFVLLGRPGPRGPARSQGFGPPPLAAFWCSGRPGAAGVTNHGLTAPSQVTDTSDSVQQGTTDPRQGNNPT
jgi:hypothetical protein